MSGGADERFLCLADIERAAGANLSPAVWDYVAGGASGEQTLTAPLGSDSLIHPEGIRAVARGAGKLGVAVAVAEASACPLEAVAEEATGPLIMQAHAWGDPDEFLDLADRAKVAGYAALCITVDCPTLGWRERPRRHRFEPTPAVWTGNCLTPERASRLTARLRNGTGSTWTWATIANLRSAVALPVLIKGILSVEDAHAAIDAGVDGVVVSNHGGRQFDTAPASLDQLPGIADAVAKRCAVLVDGGVRRGTDILKALALGADAVLLGRLSAYGLAADGSHGVETVLRLITDELRRSMVLAGIPDVPSARQARIRRRRDR
jgi:isopentenyl diphosphate isomerase/L-lactate dehydrogenase-like FMN-dependent dehydrogenase